MAVRAHRDAFNVLQNLQDGSRYSIELDLILRITHVYIGSCWCGCECALYIDDGARSRAAKRAREPNMKRPRALEYT